MSATVPPPPKPIDLANADRALSVLPEKDLIQTIVRESRNLLDEIASNKNELNTAWHLVVDLIFAVVLILLTGTLIILRQFEFIVGVVGTLAGIFSARIPTLAGTLLQEQGRRVALQAHFQTALEFVRTGVSSEQVSEAELSRIREMHTDKAVRIPKLLEKSEAMLRGIGRI